MRAGSRRSTRGSYRGIPSTVRKMDKREKAKTPSPSRMPSRVRSSSPNRTRSIRTSRVSSLSRTQAGRRPAASHVKKIIRKPRDELRSQIEPKRIMDTKSRERLMERKYIEKPAYEGSSRDHSKPLYTKEAIKSLKLRIPNTYHEKSSNDNHDTNYGSNRTFNPESVTVVRRPAPSERNGGIQHTRESSGGFPYRRFRGEGSIPMFNRHSITNDYDEGPSHIDRRPFDSSNNYSDDIRNIPQRIIIVDKGRDDSYSRRPPRDDYEVRNERSREDLRHQPSASMRRSPDRSREFIIEDKDRYDDRDMGRELRRTREIEREREKERDRDRERERNRDKDRDRDWERNRGRSDERIIRRQVSPSPRRQYKTHDDRRSRSLERRPRSLERRRRSLERRERSFERRERSFERKERTRDRFNRYEEDHRESLGPSPRRGRGNFHSSGGGRMSGRPYYAAAAIPHIPVRNIRGVVPRGVISRGGMHRGAMSRGTVFGGRMPFPPRKLFRGSMQGRL